MRLFYLITSLLTTPLCAFFAWYTGRLIYVNLTMTADEAAMHRTGGMLIGAIAFPIATLVFGAISWFSWRRFRRN